MERGVELGSLYAGFLMVVSVVMGEPLGTEYRHKSLEMVAPGSELVARFALPLQALALGLVVWRATRTRGYEPFRFAAAAVVAFIIFGKVLSPQYLLWAIPLIAALPGSQGADIRLRYLVACAVTTLLYPWAFHWFLGFRYWAIGLLIYRNLVLLRIWYDLTFDTPREVPRPLNLQQDAAAAEGPATPSEQLASASGVARAVQSSK